MPKSFKKTGLRKMYKRKKKPKANPNVEVKPIVKKVLPKKKKFTPTDSKPEPFTKVIIPKPVNPEPKPVVAPVPKKAEPIEPVKSPPMYEPEPVKKSVPIPTKAEPLSEQEFIIPPPMQDFFSDMTLIGTQMRNPTLVRPSYDIGGPIFQNYLNWLILNELMKIRNLLKKQK